MWLTRVAGSGLVWARADEPPPSRMAVSSQLPDGRAATSTGSPTGSPRSSQLEIFALRHQLSVLHRSAKRPKLADADRVFWAWKVRRKARPFEPAGRRSRTDLRDESREPLRGAPRIHGELFKFALTWARSAPASTWFAAENLHQAWRTFLENHVKSLVSADFCTVATIRFEILYVLPVLTHDRRRIHNVQMEYPRTTRHQTGLAGHATPGYAATERQRWTLKTLPTLSAL